MIPIVRIETIPPPTTEENLTEGADPIIIKVVTTETELEDRVETEILERETSEEGAVPETLEKTDEKGHTEMKGSIGMEEMSHQEEKLQDEVGIMWMEIEILVWMLFKKRWSLP